MNETRIREIVETVAVQCLRQTWGEAGGCGEEIPVEMSARHVHLSQEHVQALFGEGYQLKKKKEISQPGQYLCEERVTLIGEKGQLQNVAVLGPVRERTQAEVSVTDARGLGITPPIRLSGELAGAPAIHLMAGNKIIRAEGAVIAAQNHIHMTPEDALRFHVADGDAIRLLVMGRRPLAFCGAVVRVSRSAKLAFHIDADEANACGWLPQTKAVLEGTGCAAKEAGAKQEEAQAIFYEGKMIAARDAEGWVREGRREVSVPKGTILTPLAGDVLRDAKVTLVFAEASDREGAR